MLGEHLAALSREREALNVQEMDCGSDDTPYREECGRAVGQVQPDVLCLGTEHEDQCRRHGGRRETRE